MRKHSARNYPDSITFTIDEQSLDSAEEILFAREEHFRKKMIRKHADRAFSIQMFRHEAWLFGAPVTYELKVRTYP
jgi:hypothetical protein